MLSKIQISLATGNQPCIKVQQRESEDVRDELVKSFVSDFNHVSNTASIEFTGSFDGAIKGTDFIITPINDEINHFKEMVEKKYVSNVKNKRALLELARLICESYGGTLEMVEQELSIIDFPITATVEATK